MRTILEILRSLKPQHKAFIVGSAFVDLVIKVEALPASGADVPGTFEKASVGGCSFNVADVLSKLHLPFDALMPIGEGLMAEIVKAEFKRRGYPLTVYPGADNGWCLSLVEKDGERTFVTMTGIELKFKREWFDAFDLGSCRCVYLSGYQMAGECAAVILDALKQITPECIIVYDPGPRCAEIKPQVAQELEQRRCLYTVNAAEARILAGLSAEASLQEAGSLLSARCRRECVITDGAAGAWLFTAAGEALKIPAFKVKAADTIGAGDAHTGGIIAGLCCDLPLEEAVLLGNLTAACVTREIGAAACPDADALMQDPLVTAE